MNDANALPSRAMAMAILASVTVSIARGHQRNVQADLLGKTGADVDIRRQNIRLGGISRTSSK